MCKRGSLEWLLSFTEPSGECLEWTRCFNTDGYPRRGVKGNSNVKVHREVFKLVHGYYPEVVRHTCDNIKCINPEHLLPGDNTDNMRDRGDRGRTQNHVSVEEINLVREALAKGVKQRVVADLLGVSVKRIAYIKAHKLG